MQWVSQGLFANGFSTRERRRQTKDACQEELAQRFPAEAPEGLVSISWCACASSVSGVEGRGLWCQTGLEEERLRDVANVFLHLRNEVSSIAHQKRDPLTVRSFFYQQRCAGKKQIVNLEHMLLGRNADRFLFTTVASNCSLCLHIALATIER